MWSSYPRRSMLRHGSFLIFIFLCRIKERRAEAINEKDVKIARCRAICLDQKEDGKNSSCFSLKNCALCWNTCNHIKYNFQIWGKICQAQNISLPACEIAGVSSKKKKTANKRKRVIGNFTKKPSGKFVLEAAEIRWMKPKLHRQLHYSNKIVYILFAKNRKQPESGWSELKQTPDLSLSIKTDDIPPFPQFLLLAVDRKGIIAKIKFEFENSVGEELKMPFNKEQEEIKTFQVNVNLTEVNNTLKAVVYWNYSGSTNFTVNINWFFDTCQKDCQSEGPCSLPPQHFGPLDVRTNYGNMLPIGAFMYNSEYTIRVTVFLKSDKLFSDDIKKKTPCCEHPSDNFETCKTHQNTYTYVEPLKWEIQNTFKYNHTLNKVIANFTWISPFDKANVQYTVSWMAEKQRGQMYQLHSGSDETNNTYIIVNLEPGLFYKIKVTASDKTQQSNSQTLDATASFISPTSSSGGTSTPAVHISESTDGKSSSLKGAIVGVICIIVFVVLVVMMVIMYKKRKSFKDITIIKTTVAKSNSYKSSVTGCKMDYSGEPLIVTDEWELDPKLLKFSTPLGQGAFGKVVTGYYSQRKVAIKVVRDSAPISYKEDLLAELNLMKRIGSHPNIVSMVGACTLSEPIALVMEYVPYGNLQNFLKKCRLEGEFRRKSTGPAELTYSMVDEHGGIESGIIKPLDMLSFARQISMAMEYLAEKKYVHRDLAARNILLDCNKVVKVCDFGLSRDIYKDNQYQKLTNGKLPIKWMATESLRDRVFTTQSDVWSFGILLWEIVTMGASPYPSIALADLYYVLSSGYRMERPSNCSDELYKIMKLCWADATNERPSFTQIRLMLEDLLVKDGNYLELENIDVPLNLSENSSPPLSEISASSLAAARGPLTSAHEITAEDSQQEVSTEFLIKNPLN